MTVVYLNGEFLPVAEARIPVLDRGFLFGDGVYEVIPVYGGRPLRLADHLDRLANSLRMTLIADPHDRAGWTRLIEAVIGHAGGGDLGLYLQVTRGVAERRDHLIPERISPTVFAMPMPIPPRPASLASDGIAVITRQETRWSRCEIKAITLLPNILLRHEATLAGAQETVMVRDGHVTEGSASNLFAVFDGRLATPPLGREILPGITRTLVLEFAAAAGIGVDEIAIAATRLAAADELMISSSTREVSPVTRLDGRPVGSGRPGPVWREIDRRYQAFTKQLREGGQ